MRENDGLSPNPSPKGRGVISLFDAGYCSNPKKSTWTNHKVQISKLNVQSKLTIKFNVQSSMFKVN